MKYKIISNGLWENSKEVKKYKEIEKVVEEVFDEELKTSERKLKVLFAQSGGEHNRVIEQQGDSQLSELEQLEYLDRLSEQTI